MTSNFSYIPSFTSLYYNCVFCLLMNLLLQQFPVIRLNALTIKAQTAYHVAEIKVATKHNLVNTTLVVQTSFTLLFKLNSNSSVKSIKTNEVECFVKAKQKLLQIFIILPQSEVTAEPVISPSGLWLLGWLAWKQYRIMTFIFSGFG